MSCLKRLRKLNVVVAERLGMEFVDKPKVRYLVTAVLVNHFRASQTRR